MSTATTTFDVEWCCWAASGWEDAGEGSIRDARTTTRGQAAAFYAVESTGDIRDIRVWKRHIRPFTRQEIWAGPGTDRWVDAQSAAFRAAGVDVPLADLFAQAPETAPEDYQPGEYDPSWEFVHRSHPDAIPVWVCGFKGDEPPESPAPKAGEHAR